MQDDNGSKIRFSWFKFEISFSTKKSMRSNLLLKPKYRSIWQHCITSFKIFKTERWWWLMSSWWVQDHYKMHERWTTRSPRFWVLSLLICAESLCSFVSFGATLCILCYKFKIFRFGDVSCVVHLVLCSVITGMLVSVRSLLECWCQFGRYWCLFGCRWCSFGYG